MPSLYEIRVDSSTKFTGNRYGKSTAAWTIYRKSDLIASGVIYYYNHGPNKVFYEGIIAALSQIELEHLDKQWKAHIIVYGDCLSVIDQLNARIAVKQLNKYYDKVKAYEKSFPNVIFEYMHQNERVAEYKIVDIMAKTGMDWILKSTVIK